MILCPSCRHPNDETEYRCERCGRRFEAAYHWPASLDEAAVEGAAAPPPGLSAAPIASSSPQGAAAAAPEPWREEVSHSVERFRERRRAQQSLPLNFDKPQAAHNATASPARRLAAERPRRVIPFEQIAGAARTPPRPPRQRTGAALSGSERQPTSKASSRPGPPQSHVSRPQVPSLSQGSLAFPEPLPPPPETVNFPIAPLPARMLAAVGDVAVLACGYAVFLAVYTLLGGKFPLRHTALLALGAALAVLAFTYAALFLYLSGATPGMRWMGLRLVDLDGLPARRELRVVRLLGLLASGASLGVGFLWAAVDEHGFTWHDRISQTCLSPE